MNLTGGSHSVSNVHLKYSFDITSTDTRSVMARLRLFIAI